MFGIDFSELFIIAVVALVVIGPERLPKVAKTAGLLLGRMQRYINDVKADISREIQLEELKKLQSDIRESARDFERSITGEIKAVEQEAGQAIESVKADLAQPVAGIPEAVVAGAAHEKEQASEKTADAALPLSPPKG